MCRKIFLLLITLLFLTANTEAAKIDAYRDALLNKTFTLKYKITTLPVHETNKTDTSYSTVEAANQILSSSIDVPHGGIIVTNGSDRYVELFHENYSQTVKTINPITKMVESKKVQSKEGGVCTLIKNNEVFTFLWEMKNDQKDYYAKKSIWGKKRSVKANETAQMTPYQSLIEEYTYGAPEIAGALLAIMPPEKIIDNPNIPQYRFLNSGTLSNGLTYEDFVSDKPTIFSAVRYYFNGNNLVKIAMATYARNAGKVLAYEKSVIDIDEFSTAPDQSYLSLPESLKDKTKRKEGATK